MGTDVAECKSFLKLGRYEKIAAWTIKNMEHMIRMKQLHALSAQRISHFTQRYVFCFSVLYCTVLYCNY